MTPDAQPLFLAQSLRFGPVTLSVANLERSKNFYTQTLGMRVLSESTGTVLLGADSTSPLLELREQAGARPSLPSSTGLYHLAILLPTRVDLAAFVQHLIDTRSPVQGASDHLVSEALYLTDPDGHGLEVYWDHPEAQWQWDGGSVQMATNALDLENLLLELTSNRSSWTLPSRTTLGHVHLKVSDMSATEHFYRDVLGFDITARFAGALFMSVGGYHHHLGLNAWGSRGGKPGTSEHARLERVKIRLPEGDSLERLSKRLNSENITFERVEDGLEVQDPAGNLLEFRI